MTRCRRSSFLLTYTGSNDLKLILDAQETSLYKVIVAFVLGVSLNVCSRAPNLGEIIAMSVILAVFSGSFVHFIVCLYSSYCLKCAQINSAYVGDVPIHENIVTFFLLISYSKAPKSGG